MSAIMALFSGENDICHQSNDDANNAAATGGNTEHHFFHAAFLWRS
jgi:hypothetical protein